MRVYVAGPLFTPGERQFLDGVAARLRAEGVDCFVPHEKFQATTSIDPVQIFSLDYDGMQSCDVLLAWLDGPSIDDGTCAEIGIFSEWVRSGDKKGLIGYCTDLRRLRNQAPAHGLNLFVAGALQSVGQLHFDLDEAITAVLALR